MIRIKKIKKKVSITKKSPFLWKKELKIARNALSKQIQFKKVQKGNLKEFYAVAFLHG
jgi:hypothetical protein